MRMQRRGVGLVLLLLACKPATQVTFDISTDVPCDRISGTSITVGVEGATEREVPVEVVRQCTPGGTINAIGTYTLVPAAAKTGVTASIKLAMGVGPDVDVESDCTAAKQYANCVVARRRVSFVTSRSLTVPVELLLKCTGVACDENSTCSRAGKCVTSKVDTSRCDSAGACTELETRTSEGLPCFNGTGVDALFCSGSTSWCTQSADGQRACAAMPTPGAIAFQCRDSADCGNGLTCVAGSGGVLGQCVNTVPDGGVVLCSPGEQVSPCAGGARYCRSDAGPGLYQCDEPPRRWDGGIYEGLPCPRDGELRCYGATPFCSQYQETPRCVADGGAQCWYNADCPPGQGCFAGTGGTFSNVCAPNPTPTNPYPLCDPRLGAADCSAGLACDGAYYANRVCRTPCPAGRADCNGFIADSCEVTLDTDPKNCGGCGQICDAPNGTPGCAAGSCTIASCAAGYVDCNGSAADGCELKNAGRCTPTGALCRAGALSCSTRYGVPQCTPGAQLPAGSDCGYVDAGVCNATGDCMCKPGVPVNTPCGEDSICDATSKCVQNRFWVNPGCVNGIVGNTECVTRGFARATSAWGYIWSQCTGPNANVGSIDNCKQFDATRSRCLRWTPGVDCAGFSLGNTYWGTSLREFGGPPGYTFNISDWWTRGCNGWNPGTSIRLSCEF